MQLTLLTYGDKGQIFVQHNDNRGRCLCNMLVHSTGVGVAQSI